MRHGLDADHLATIDGLTRHNARANPASARFCGALFSLGHGLVACAVAIALAAQTPVVLADGVQKLDRVEVIGHYDNSVGSSDAASGTRFGGV